MSSIFTTIATDTYAEAPYPICSCYDCNQYGRRPVMPNTADGGRAKNRRVEVLVTK